MLGKQTSWLVIERREIRNITLITVGARNGYPSKTVLTGVNIRVIFHQSTSCPDELEHTDMSPIKRLSRQVRALQAQDYAAVEHCFQDEPVDCPEDISVDKLDVVFERRHVFMLHRSDIFTL